MTAPKVTFNYSIPDSIELSMPLVRKTLREVQAQLLAHDINGGGKKLAMDSVTAPNSCGMAACIGGWTSLFLLGFDKTRDSRLKNAADDLFDLLWKLDDDHGNGRLHALFYDYTATIDHNEPNVAATAIKRYLAGKTPWSEGEMPNVLPYTKRASRKRK